MPFLALPLVLVASRAGAEGALNIYNWGDYTSPALIEKFEQSHHVAVTITDFDSNDTALARVKAGGHGFDMVVPSSNFIPIWIRDGLLLESRPDLMSSFAHLDPRWVDVPFDPGRRYSVPWQWGVTGVIVDTSVYAGDIDSWRVIFEPPEVLAGRINVPPEMSEVVTAAVLYLGGRPCTDDHELLRRVQSLLRAARAKWLSMDYVTPDGYAKHDFAAGMIWNGDALRARLRRADLRFGFPREGFPIWMDNLAILKDAKNVANARLFMNFVMEPDNAAMLSAFTHYANGIRADQQRLPAEMAGAPELVEPDGAKGVFVGACPPEANQLMARIWAELQQ